MGGWGYAWILGGSEELKPEPRTRYPIPSSRSCGWHILIRPPASITRRTTRINHPERNHDDNQEEEPDDAFEDTNQILAQREKLHQFRDWGMNVKRARVGVES